MKPFPGESPAYRAARGKLLTAEIELRRKTEEVAALRRSLPLGGAVEVDYAFEEVDGKKTRLVDLFGDKSTLLVYSFMFGPKMTAPCPMCTSFLDGLNGQAHHITQKVHHFWSSEMFHTDTPAGQDARHIDIMWPLWIPHDEDGLSAATCSAIGV
ncbi:MAG: DUF899 family protein [Polyangiales bacterium]